jgi:ProP effector
MTKSNGHDKNIAAVLKLLAERWPAAFSIFEGRRRPLKIGIHLEILAALDGAVTEAELRNALRCFVANPVYRARLVAGAVRIGLAGEPDGVVTAEQIPPKKPSTKQLAKKTPPKKTVPAVAAPPPAPAPTPARLSLADLRRAAQLRKEAAEGVEA